MPWSNIISTDDVVAIHAALLPTDNGDGQIVLFGGDDHYIANAPPQSTNYDHTRSFNCRNPTQALQYVKSPPWDVFCSGHAMIGDGRLLVAGGTDDFPLTAGPIHSPKHHFAGHRHCAAYNFLQKTFSVLADMQPEPGRNDGKGGGRWYPTLCTLGTGEVLAFQGHPNEDDYRHGNTIIERYQPLTNSWVGDKSIGNTRN